MRFRNPLLPLHAPTSWAPVAAALGVAALGLQTTTAAAADGGVGGAPPLLRGCPDGLYSVQALRGHRPYMEDTNHVSH